MVLVSGCYDLLHAGHIEFFKKASTYGKLHVVVASDEAVKNWKGRYPASSQQERLEVVKSVYCVHDAVIGSEDSDPTLDFKEVFITLRPKYLIVNEDGDNPQKQAMCQEYGTEYIVLARESYSQWATQSSTNMKNSIYPFRLNLVGGWIDQPWVSQFCSGSVVNIALWGDYSRRGGMATSTRHTMMKLWDRMPTNYEESSKLLFGADNPPGTKNISGSQDAIGLVYPGVIKMDYNGSYWPDNIDYTVDRDIMEWVESVVKLKWTYARHDDYDLLEVFNPITTAIKQLGESGQMAWQAIHDMDASLLKDSVELTYDAWKHIVPKTIIDLPDGASGVCGAGGGGYAIFIGEDHDADKIQVRY